MARIGGTGPPRWLFDYVQDAAPDSPNAAESWYDTGSQEVKVYTGSAWKKTGVVSHDALTNVTEADHHNPVTVSGPLTEDGTQGLGLSIGNGLANSNGSLVAALGNGLGIDANGQVYIPASAVSQSMLGFDPATQTELDGHASDTTNPHNVTDDQTGAASALSTHAGDANAHHSPPTSTGTSSSTGPFTQIDSRSYAASEATTNTFPQHYAAVEVQIRTSCGTYNAFLHDVEGNTIASKSGVGGNTTLSFPVNHVKDVYVNNRTSSSYTFDFDVRAPGTESHSHPI